MSMRLFNHKTIGNWTYDPTFGRFFSREGDEFFLDQRLNKLLMLLVDRQDKIVKREEIIDYVWKNVLVNEENLTKGIFDLRKLLKQKGLSELQIDTIRNVGYRLTIQEEEKPLRPMVKLMLKSTIYLFLLLSLAIMFIRAIRYEN
jgi:DNA-binding winged helix-turn-helix (wHTH) protein